MQDATIHLRASTSVRKLRKRRRWISAPIGWRTGNRDGRGGSAARHRYAGRLRQPAWGQVATSQGNAQHLVSGGEFVGWGILPYISKFDAAGKLVFNAQFPAGVNT